MESSGVAGHRSPQLCIGVFPIQLFICNTFSNVKCGEVTVLAGRWDFEMEMIRAKHQLGGFLWCCCTVTPCFWLEGGWCFLAALFWVIKALELFRLVIFFLHSCIGISLSYSYSDENKRENSHMLSTLSATSGLSKEACAWAKFCRGKQLLCFCEICI